MSDATEMAQIVENGREISLQEFVKMCQVDQKVISQIQRSIADYSFFINDDSGIAWIYDDRRDIHYFYA
jgi:hypothetical protein